MNRMKWLQRLDRSGTRRTYDEAERQSWVGEFDRRRAKGESVRAIAQALGVSSKNYYHWKRRCETPAALPVLRSVALVDAVVTSAGACPVVVSPQGYRVEGLSVADVATLLRALR